MTELATPAVQRDGPLEGGPLSTAPAGKLPGGSGVAAALRRGWRRLTSMRTALLLLALLAVAAVPGTLLPQRGLNPVKVDQFLGNHPHLGPWLDRLSLFDVFAAPWFAAIYLLLFVSLVGCLVPRIRLHARALRRRPPAAPRYLERLALHAGWDAPELPTDLAERTRALLRARHWRADVRVEDDGAVAVAAEKGYLRETGNLVFHVALVLLLAGIALGGLFGYKGTALVVDGQGFANVRSSYDVFEPSRLYRDSQLAPFSFTLRRFSATYEPNGEPRTFDALVGYRASPDAASTPYDIRVNHPLAARGANVFLIGHGYAVRIQVRDPSGRLVYDRATPFLPDDSMFTSHGVVKVPDGLPHQLGLTGFFFPTYGVTARGPASTFPGLRDPVLELAAWRGDLGLDSGAPQSVYSLPVASLRSAGERTLTPGQTWRLADGSTVRFAGVEQWATFQIAHQPGQRTVLAAAVLIVGGLLASLRVRRRRFWLRARRLGAGADARTVVVAAGLARTDGEATASEFETLVGRLKD
jgi:cytochrome c biogenesis protein